MTELILISPRQYPLRPLVEAALRNELRALQAGIERTESRIRTFEARYGLSSEEFLRRYEDDEIEETPEIVEWVGEWRLLASLRERSEVLREIRFAN